VSAATRGARKALIWLGVILGLLYGLLGIGVANGNASWLPSLGLDLAGGRQIILEAVTTDGTEVTQSDLDQAVEIIRRRVDASGVTEAEISTAGTSNIIVSLPGNPDEATLDLVRRSAQLQFRPVLVVGDPGAIVSPSATPTPSPSASASPSPSPGESISPVTDVTPSPSASPEPTVSAEPDDAQVPTPLDPSDYAWITPEIQEQFESLDCFVPANRAGAPTGDPDAAHVACAEDGSAKYVLGPVELSGSDVATAVAGPELAQGTGALTGRYEIRLDLTGEGGAKFAVTTERLSQMEQPRNQFAILLDGAVLSDPAVSQKIAGGTASITGGFTQESSQQLANQLKFGALPLTLEVQSELQIPATKGAEDLQAGLIAGAIGLLLVVIYSMFQYRALGAVTVGSLAIAGLLTLVVFSLLSWGLGLRLSLAGIAGLIVAIGITADSFIVFFERIKDEIRDGRSLQSAIDHGWPRARRTILISDAVSFLAAVVLYVLAVGGVRGFAFTLGLTTLVDLIVVLLFTQPVLVLLARTKFFGRGHKWSGLDPESLGRDSLYKGAGKVRAPRVIDAESGADPAEQKLTLAERKALERASAGAGTEVE